MTRRELCTTGTGFAILKHAFRFGIALPVPALPSERTRRAVTVTHAKGESVSFSSAGRPLFTFRYSSARPKTYVHPFYGPDGTALTLDGPEDHVHHRGLMLAWSAVNGYDFWGETNPGPHGQIVHQRFEGDPERAGVVVSVEHWIADGKVLVIEKRTIRPLELPEDSVGLEWQSELRAADARVTLSAEGHPYDGLGIRFVHEMDGGRVLNAKGTAEIAKANGEPAAWCAYGTGAATVAIFDSRRNARYPAPFFVMNQPFGYLSAAPTFREPFDLRPGTPLRLRYAVIGYAAGPDASLLNGIAKKWE